MSPLPNLLDQLIALTAIRDLELLEQSLLKTMAASLSPSDIAVYHLDAAGRPFGALRVVDGRCEVEHEAIVIPETLMRTIATSQRSGVSRSASVPCNSAGIRFQSRCSITPTRLYMEARAGGATG